MTKNSPENTEKKRSLNFLEQIIEKDLAEGKNEKRVHTRFPPEPNGYLHIGHAKSICLNFGLAEKYKGLTNLRFDDTNPVKEDVEYVDSIKEDIKWLGFDWEEREYYASDYFDQLYEWAIKLIKDGKAYVDELDQEDFAKNYRGTVNTPGKNSPYRNRPMEENLDLFERMKNGEFPDGSKVLRAKIDMASPNMLMRDPALYRIKHATHHRTGDKWCIYPMYDYAHGQSDYIEGITHSICTLEFDIHRPLYDWLIEQIVDTEYRPHQYEFARLNLSYTIMSKRKLLKLVEEKYVSGWNDPRMPTISGFRRRGYTPESIRYFADKVGVAKRDNVIDVALLEHSIREDLNKIAQRVMAVLDPVKLVIDNYPENETEEIDAVNNPEDESMGKRKVPFSKELYIERKDFIEDPPRKFFRLAPDREVRLRYAYIIKCVSVEKDEDGKITTIHCTYDPDTKSGSGKPQRKVKGTIHWVSAEHAVNAEIRLYDRLFLKEDPNKAEEGKDFTSNLNPDSLNITHGKIEPFVEGAKPDDKFQFERTGYFCVDKDSKPGKLLFNRTVPLRDSWAKRNK
ncbi:MAG: glutamine--tRNA ligase/YqeY domain fusion protein [Bacteroidales bacterium]|nr:glutamine--tRNA ligase/YqeY domain fusion protein [Bacteroidales bacterium]MCF8349779.1 glutamine--tRNA ligase/YqeY domain fusion protein [Bacteroidales bacterium]MCF8376298.1 glutamine--tRNA ligase/YqeY domain fusion protein [Bacteroidales bacterium]MCF8400992.1 glutamine--tRNA ligase/YqeY domain fusion protein [Bacteroidales bacterium]